MAASGNELPPLVAGDEFDRQFCHNDIELVNHSKTAVLEDVDIGEARYVMGRNIYHFGEHDIRLRLDNVSRPYSGWIGMTNTPQIPIHYPAKHDFIGWCMYSAYYVNAYGVLSLNSDLGKPWITGDVLHLHLDREHHTLRLNHLRSGKSHTILNVMGAQRLFVEMRNSWTAISLVDNR